MARQDAWDKPFVEEGEGAVQFRPPPKQGEEVDMTPMIDCVFLLLIFFLVGSIPDVQTAVDLAPARHGKGADPNSAVFITIADSGGKSADVYLADGKVGSPLSKDPKVQQTAITAAVKDGLQSGKSSVIIKAEKTVKHKEVNRVATAAAAAQPEGIRMFLAVFELK
ncbi:MAG: biopolymer transporter ExbD [Pirellulales bacterium]|nr:biopolymer transporter ExbD [Pirellulales bacterium]